jgi:protein-S-isoprenylcysteine O-methyltransferase Ste14
VRTRTAAAAGSSLFFALAPGVMAGLVPWLLTGWDPKEPFAHYTPLRVAGALLTAVGAAFVVHSFARFVSEGIGTPAPVAPTQKLVVGGLYRHVRNPMYLAVTTAIVGQALLLGRPILVAWAALFLATTAAFVRVYEEPTLARRFGSEYERYRRDVPGWWPRLRPWQPGE